MNIFGLPEKAWNNRKFPPEILPKAELFRSVESDIVKKG